MPTPATVPRRAHRAAVALAAAGASGDPTNVTQYPAGRWQLPAGIVRVTAWTTITRQAGKAGQVAVRARFSNNVSGGPVEESTEPVVNTTIAVTGTRGQQNVSERELALPAPPGDTAYVAPPVSFDVPAGALFVWIDAFEIGVTLFPSTASIFLTASGVDS